MEQPLISVIVPVYKVEPYLRQCVDSIINQTYTNLEIILIDDGSPDRCPEICDEYAAKDSRVRVIHQKNSGVSAARNAGLNIASGDYIGFVDADDWIEPNMYEELLRSILQFGSDYSYCSFSHFKTDGSFYSENFGKSARQTTGETLCSSFLLGTGDEHGSLVNKLFTMDCIGGVRFDDDMRVAEDAWFFLQILSKNPEISFVDKSMYVIRHTNDTSWGNNTYLLQSRANYDLAVRSLVLLPDIPQLMPLFKEFLIRRYFIYANYLAIDNLRKEYTDLTRQFRKLLKQHIGDSSHLSLKYKAGLLMVNVSPQVFWFITRAKMRRLKTD